MQHVFAYGTLRPHSEGIEPQRTWNFEQIRHDVIAHEPATTLGTLHTFGRFPGMAQGETVIHGDLLSVNDEALQIMDRIEGHPFFFRRELVTVQTASGEKQAWMYWGPEECKDLPVIETGNWFFQA